MLLNLDPIGFTVFPVSFDFS